MADSRIENMARLLVQYCVELQPGQTVALQGTALALPLLREVYREALRAGAHPMLEIQDEEIEEILLKEGNDAQLTFIQEPERYRAEKFDARIYAISPVNSRYLSGVNREKQALRRRAYTPLREAFFQRTAAGTFRWVTTAFPTPAAAQDADMSLRDYENFVYGAMKLDSADPVAEWLELYKRQQKICDWLGDKKTLTVKGANVDMTLSIAGRTFINDEGKFNMPGGEIFTGPVEDSVNGWVRFSYPAIYGGNEVNEVELTFEQGKVVKATATKGEEYLQAVLETDTGARYLGEWAIGTNDAIQRFSRNMLFDEKIGGTIHMAIGASYPESGGVNQSAVHWDMLCDMRDGGEIAADGEVFYRGGTFLIDTL
jgi:aminopeptidase